MLLLTENYTDTFILCTSIFLTCCILPWLLHLGWRHEGLIMLVFTAIIIFQYRSSEISPSDIQREMLQQFKKLESLCFHFWLLVFLHWHLCGSIVWVATHIVQVRTMKYRAVPHLLQGLLCCVQDSAVFGLSASLLIVCDISGGYD